MIVQLTVNEFGVHISQPGRAGESFDAGENGDELGLAMLEAGKEILERYERRQAELKKIEKNKEALDGFFGTN